MNKFFAFFMTITLSFLVTTKHVAAQECRIKQVPKMDLFIYIMGYKTEWIKVENIKKLSECISAAEVNLAKANGVEVISSIGDLFSRIILSIYEPEYVKAIKVEFRDEFNQLTKLKIRYKKVKTK